MGHNSETQLDHTRAWKLFVLTSRLLLTRPGQKGDEGKRVLLDRVRRYLAGEWSSLLDEAQARATRRMPTTRLTAEQAEQRRLETACERVRQGEVSRARQVLTAPSRSRHREHWRPWRLPTHSTASPSSTLRQRPGERPARASKAHSGLRSQLSACKSG